MFNYGSVGDGVIWKQIYGEYKADRLDNAAELLASVGVGPVGHGLAFSRMIEAEYGTRKGSFVEPQDETLILEMRQQSPLEQWEQLRESARRAFEATASALGFAESPKVLVTLIFEELDTPWTPGRFGFHTLKQEYHKICLPERIMERPTELHQALMHEYSHVVSSYLTQETCPTWLDEAIAMAVSEARRWHFRDEVLSGRAAWLDHSDLDIAFHGAIGDPEEAARMHRAYEQASWIGAYLSSLKGTKGLGELLAAFGDNSFWDEVKIRVLGVMRADEALKQTFEISVQETFEQARSFLEHGHTV